MSNKKNSLGSFAALFLALFFSIIVLFYLFVFLKITRYDVFPAVMIFAMVNLSVILLLSAFGKPIIKRIGNPIFSAICTITGIYSLFQFVYMGFRYDKVAMEAYILYQLIVLFIYLLIVIPIGILGININKTNGQLI